MAIGSHIANALQRYRTWRAERIAGPLGAYHRAGGKRLLFEDLPVGANDVILDVGGYRGDWTAEMCWRYGCRVIILEPVPRFAEEIAKRFERNSRVTVIAAGLGPRDGQLPMFVADDGSSFVRAGSQGQQKIEAPVISARRLFEEQRIDAIACLKMNIEGAEYDLLDSMCADHHLPRMGCLLIQFHDVGPATSLRLDRTRAAIAKTHVPKFRFDLVWERWDSPAPRSHGA